MKISYFIGLVLIASLALCACSKTKVLDEREKSKLPKIRGAVLTEASNDHNYFSSKEEACAGHNPIDFWGSIYKTTQITCDNGVTIEKLAYLLIPDDTGPIIAYVYRRRK